MKKIFKIRFNTKFMEANDVNLKWRIIDGDTEHLVREIKVSVPCFTSEDIIGTGETKWHLSCQGHLSINDNQVAVID